MIVRVASFLDLAGPDLVVIAVILLFLAAPGAIAIPIVFYHQITNDGAQDLILYVVADNPLGESYYQPDSNEWTVPIPVRRVIRSEAQD